MFDGKFLRLEDGRRIAAPRILAYRPVVRDVVRADAGGTRTVEVPHVLIYLRPDFDGPPDIDLEGNEALGFLKRAEEHCVPVIPAEWQPRNMAAA
jgi:hypothetical protein